MSKLKLINSCQEELDQCQLNILEHCGNHCNCSCVGPISYERDAQADYDYSP